MTGHEREKYCYLFQHCRVILFRSTYKNIKIKRHYFSYNQRMQSIIQLEYPYFQLNHIRQIMCDELSSC